MDSTKSSRFTVLNSDNDSIYISKNLKNKISQQNQQNESQQPSASSSPPSSSSSFSPASELNPSGDHHHHHRHHQQKLPQKPATPSAGSANHPSSSPGSYFDLGGHESYASQQQLKPQQSSALSVDNPITMPPSLDPEYVAKHIDFDASTNLYGLHGKYERKLQQYQQSWRAKWEELNVLNDKLFKLNSDKFAKEVKRVDERYFRDHKTYERPCNDAERKVFDCYVRNGKKPLLCIDEVQQFSACVDKARVDLLKR